jgi:hypothetical protein
VIIPDDKVLLFPTLSPFRPSCAWEIGEHPDDAEPRTVFSVDRRGPFVLPFKCCYHDGRWWNHMTGDVLRIKIHGWR